MSTPERDENAEKLIATPYPSSFSYDTTYSVVIPHAIDRVYAVLSDPNNIEAILKLQTQLGVSDVVLMRNDTVQRTPVFAADTTRLRTAPAAEGGFPRQFFYYMAFDGGGQGAGTYSSDPESHSILYETNQDGYMMWKMRTLEEEKADDGSAQTKVTEKIQGVCPWIYKAIIRREAGKQQALYMPRWVELFA